MSNRLRTHVFSFSSIIAVALSIAVVAPNATATPVEQQSPTDSLAVTEEDPQIVVDGDEVEQEADSSITQLESPASGADADENLVTPPAEQAAKATTKEQSPAPTQVSTAPKAKTKQAAPKVAQAKPKAAVKKVDPNNRCEIPRGLKSGHKNFKSRGVTRFGSTNQLTLAAQVFNRAANTSGKKQRAVFLASAADVAGGSALTALASKYGWPVVVTSGKSLNKSARAAVKKVNPTHIYIAGGTGTVSKSVENAAKKLGSGTVKVKRFTGSRYVVARKIADCFPAGTPAFVVNGKNSAETVVATSAAVRKGGAVVLAQGNRATPGAKKTLGVLKSKKVYAIGGKWTKTSQNALRKSAGRSATIRVFAGKNIYQTSSRVAAGFWPKSARKTVVYSRANNQRHGLATLSVSRQAKAPVLMTKATCRPSEIATVSKSATAQIVMGSKKHLNAKSYKSACKPKQTKQQKIVSIAKSLNGKSYRSGGTGPHSFDCSGFTQYVYKKAGIKIPRTTWSQWSAGKKVSSPKAGDVVVMSGGGHVAIYLGKGMIIDAGTPRTGVSIRQMWAPANAYVRFT